MSPNKKIIEDTLKQLSKYDNVNDDLLEFFRNILKDIHSLRELKKKITNEFIHLRMFYTNQKELYNKEIRFLESRILDLSRELREFDRTFTQLRQNLGRLQVTSEESLLHNINRFTQITETRIHNCRRQSYIFGIEIFYDYVHQYNNKFENVIQEYNASKNTLSSHIQKFYEDLLQIQTCCERMYNDEFIVKEQYDVIVSKFPTETRIEDVASLPELQIYDVKQIIPKVYHDADFTDELALVQIVQQQTPPLQQTPQQTPSQTPRRSSRRRQIMIQCESCSKWRVCSREIAEEFKEQTFICELNYWDPQYNRCDVPDDNIDYSNQNEMYLSESNNTNVQDEQRPKRRRRNVVVESDDDL